MDHADPDNKWNRNPRLLRLGGKPYFVHTPWWLKKIYPRYQWEVPTREKTLYLSFDDGPHPVATPFVLDQLKKYNAKATFFCIGKNVINYPGLYQRILEEGHATGNHTHQHLNGWKTSDPVYLNDIKTAAALINSRLFRPPYGRIRASQVKKLGEAMGYPASRIIMWSVLTGDFDTDLTRERCLERVKRHTRPGSIILFHDSEKAFPRMAYTLPRMLEHFTAAGYRFSKLE